MSLDINRIGRTRMKEKKDPATLVKGTVMPKRGGGELGNLEF